MRPGFGFSLRARNRVTCDSTLSLAGSTHNAKALIIYEWSSVNLIVHFLPQLRLVLTFPCFIDTRCPDGRNELHLVACRSHRRRVFG